MEEAMEKDAIEVASYALNEFNVESQMANHIKREFDKKYRCVRSHGAMQAACVCNTNLCRSNRMVPPALASLSHRYHSIHTLPPVLVAALHGTW